MKSVGLLADNFPMKSVGLPLNPAISWALVFGCNIRNTLIFNQIQLNCKFVHKQDKKEGKNSALKLQILLQFPVSMQTNTDS